MTRKLLGEKKNNKIGKFQNENFVWIILKGNSKSTTIGKTWKIVLWNVFDPENNFPSFFKLFPLNLFINKRFIYFFIFFVFQVSLFKIKRQEPPSRQESKKNYINNNIVGILLVGGTPTLIHPPYLPQPLIDMRSRFRKIFFVVFLGTFELFFFFENIFAVRVTRLLLRCSKA